MPDSLCRMPSNGLRLFLSHDQQTEYRNLFEQPRQGSTQQITEAEMRMLDRFFREEIEAKRLDDSFARLREELRHLPPVGDDETSLY